ncbi:hypothetical protein YpsIP31758_B0069 (plasmid) [Yersinia pseudotuberculosis IP 31758]|uniref:Uncharacterized protein n=1 Tax=Yersinia pseudotuberculosis serotype O:1b (strain IP 31758) TaxID=349747 RepID=A0A0U1QTF8_YERP3|nr:hypothetical protein YpsIP31758_B0069 [Yersinia pseudotuberculosis IP 31758]
MTLFFILNTYALNAIVVGIVRNNIIIDIISVIENEMTLVFSCVKRTKNHTTTNMDVIIKDVLNRLYNVSTTPSMVVEVLYAFIFIFSISR